MDKNLFSREERIKRMRERQEEIKDEEASHKRILKKLNNEWNDLQTNAWELSTLTDFNKSEPLKSIKCLCLEDYKKES